MQRFCHPAASARCKPHLSFTYTRAAQAQEPGRFHTRPATATSCTHLHSCWMSHFIKVTFTADGRCSPSRCFMMRLLEAFGSYPCQTPCASPHQMRRQGCLCTAPGRSHRGCTCCGKACYLFLNERVGHGMARATECDHAQQCTRRRLVAHPKRLTSLSDSGTYFLACGSRAL